MSSVAVVIEPVSGPNGVVYQYRASAPDFQSAVEAVQDSLEGTIQFDAALVREQQGFSIDEWNDGDYNIVDELVEDQSAVRLTAVRRNPSNNGYTELRSLLVQDTEIPTAI